MHRTTRHAPWIAGALLAALLVAGIASAALADHGHGRRYKGARPSWSAPVAPRYCGPGSAYVVRRSNADPAIAGFLGGLFLGATLAHAAPAGFSYYDPYCGERFGSLEIYRAHLHHHHHPRIVRVIELESGDCVHTYRYQQGRWDDWDDEAFDED